MSHRRVVTSGRSVIVHRWADGGGYSHGFIAKGRGEVVLPAGSKIWAEALIQRLSQPHPPHPRTTPAFTHGVAEKGLAAARPSLTKVGPGASSIQHPKAGGSKSRRCAMDPAREPNSPEYDDAPLDSYSKTVMRVAETVTPHVAAIEMTGNRRNGRFRFGAGSAVLFTKDGYLLTNSHVVAGTNHGQAVFADGSRTELELVGVDPLSDLAVIRGRAPKVPPAEFGDAESLRVGQLVVAVGNPLGLAGSVTAGVVSGLGRAIPVWSGGNRRVIEDVIQTDAALNSGSSGGALADTHSRIVGINTAVAGAGLGLAVPINTTTRRIISALLSDGRVRRAYLGVVSTPIRLNASTVVRTGQRDGLRVVEVLAGSPADNAGIQAGDIILTAGGRPVSNAESLQKLLFADAIGQPLQILVSRDGRELDLVAVPEEMAGPG